MVIQEIKYHVVGYWLYLRKFFTGVGTGLVIGWSFGCIFGLMLAFLGPFIAIIGVFAGLILLWGKGKWR